MARWLRLLVVMGLLSAPQLLPASSASPPVPVPELGRTNIFKAERSGYVEVRIPEDTDLELDFFGNDNLKVTGDGRFAGLFLVRVDVPKPQGLYGGTFRVCAEEACAKGWSGWVTRFFWPVGFKWQNKKPIVTVPAGLYRAYVITDGAPVTARLSLPELQGSQSLSAVVPIKTEVGIQSSPIPASNLFSAGSTHELTTNGAAIMGFVERNSASSADLSASCLYEGLPPVPDEIAYLPTCGALGAEPGYGASQSFPPLASSGSSGSFSLDPRVPRGKWSWGGTYAAAQVVENAAFVSVWVDYE
jgi:hypothetical protein